MREQVEVLAFDSLGFSSVRCPGLDIDFSIRELGFD